VAPIKEKRETSTQKFKKGGNPKDKPEHKLRQSKRDEEQELE